MSHPRYRRIAPLPTEHAALASAELPALVGVWRERRTALEEDGRLGPFLERLRREWAIETGLIERLYTWDRGVTEVLIAQGIDAAIITGRTHLDRSGAEQARRLILDQQSVIEGIFEFVKGDRRLSEHYVRSLHQALTASQPTTEALEAATGRVVDVPLLRGEYKRLPNNPRRVDGTTHAYCPPELVADEMQALISGFDTAAATSVAPEVLAAWLHHRFTRIHPFQDGNGRVARALASLVFLQRDLFPLVLRDRDRVAYIDALERADDGDLAPLTALFARRQRDVILDALNTDRAVEKGLARDSIVAAALEQLRRRRDAREDALNRVFDTSQRLHQLTGERFDQLARDLDPNLAALTPPDVPKPYNAEAKRGTDETAHGYRGQIIDTARALGYWADLNAERRWARLSIQTGAVFELVVSFHGHGREFAGVLVAAAFVGTRIKDDDGATHTSTAEPICLEPFQLNYLEALDVATQRYEAWLDDVITLGLEAWRRSLAG